MTYLGLLEVLEAAATTVAPTATYYRGRIQDVSLDSHDANEVIIYVLDTMRIEPDANNIFERWNIRIGFFKQDSTSSESMTVNQVQSGEQSREDIFSDMHVLARQYYDALFNEENIQIAGQPSYSQLTRELQGTYSGWGLDIGVLIEVGCEQTEINDAIYQNAETNPNFQQSIKRGEVYVAPQITVTDSDQSQYLQDANTDVVCTPSASPATAILDDTVGNEISITSIPPGTTEHITAPDGTINLVNTDNDPIQAETVRSNQTKSATIPNVAWTDSDLAPMSTPYGDAIVCTAQVKTVELYFAFTSGTDTSALATNGGTTWTLTAISDDGASGTITVSDNGGAYGAFSNPTTIANGETIQVKRTSTGSAGWVLITGTYA